MAFREVLAASVFKSWASTDSTVLQQLGSHKVDSLLRLSSLEPHTVELLEPGRYLDPRDYIETELGSGQIVRRTLATDHVTTRLAAGATLVVNGADRFDPCVMSNREYLEYLVGTICWCNVYFSQTTRSPFGRHSDTHDVLVVQGGGEKRWTVHHPETGDAVFDGVITTGDVLYIPQGWEHEVTGTGTSSTHWTFGFNRAASQWTALAILSSKAREGFFDELSAADFTRAVGHELSELLAPDDGPAEARVFTERRAGGSFAYSGADVPLQHVAIRMAPRIPPAILPSTDANVFRLLAAGKLFRIGERMRPAFELLMRGTQVAATALTTQCAIEDPRRLIEWGIANGLLIASVTP
ncbi:Cupin superfamily protein [Mycobacteroides salmoniphilum]|nr:Cupin superfamily protein [Mycobacteroides salmoniphilum]TDZ86833.1 Cupin superfamily protein [Mycobacteroides salmoniphilum]